MPVYNNGAVLSNGFSLDNNRHVWLNILLINPYIHNLNPQIIMKKLAIILWLATIFGSFATAQISNDTTFFKQGNKLKMVVSHTEITVVDSCTIANPPLFSRKEYKQLFSGKLVEKAAQDVGSITDLLALPIKFEARERHTTYQKTNGKTEVKDKGYYSFEEQGVVVTLTIVLIITYLMTLITAWDNKKRKINYWWRMLIYYIIINIFIWLSYLLSSSQLYLILAEALNLIATIAVLVWLKIINWRIYSLIILLFIITIFCGLFKMPAEIHAHSLITFWFITTILMALGIVTNLITRMILKRARINRK